MTTIRRPHYAWAVCLGGALVLFATMGLGVNVFSIYQPEIIAARGFSNAQGSWITTTRSLFILLGLCSVKQLCDRLGLRLVMSLGAALVGLSCLCFAHAQHFAAYCFAAALTGLGYCYGGMVPLSMAIGQWFSSRRNLALGLASAGSGISTIFAPMAIRAAIARHGLMWSFRMEGLFILAVALLAWLLLRDGPAQMGLSPYGLQQAPSAAAQPADASSPKSGAVQWALLLLGAFLLGGPGGPGYSHLTVLYTHEGYAPAFVAALISLSGGMLCIGKVLCGQIYDRLGGRLGNLWSYGTLLASLLLCCAAPLGSQLLPVAAIVLLGLGLPVSAVSLSVWAADLTAPAAYGAAVRSLNIAYNIGVLSFGPLPGILADRLGSYVPAYLCFSVVLVGSMALVQSVYRLQGAGARPRR